jgi:hypothetical protein
MTPTARRDQKVRWLSLKERRGAFRELLKFLGYE